MLVETLDSHFSQKSDAGAHNRDEFTGMKIIRAGTPFTESSAEGRCGKVRSRARLDASETLIRIIRNSHGRIDIKKRIVARHIDESLPCTKRRTMPADY